MKTFIQARLKALLPNPMEIGNGAGDIFFYRYTLVKCRWFSLFLHQFIRSDHDRCLHDHPWFFVSLVLWGGYWEQLPDGKHWRNPGSLLVRPATTLHRIEIEPGSHPWSLVFVGRKVRRWGFMTLNGWEQWKPGRSPVCEAEPPKVSENPLLPYVEVREVMPVNRDRGPAKPPTLADLPVFHRIYLDDQEGAWKVRREDFWPL